MVRYSADETEVTECLKAVLRHRLDKDRRRVSSMCFNDQVLADRVIAQALRELASEFDVETEAAT